MENFLTDWLWLGYFVVHWKVIAALAVTWWIVAEFIFKIENPFAWVPPAILILIVLMAHSLL